MLSSGVPVFLNINREYDPIYHKLLIYNGMCVTSAHWRTENRLLKLNSPYQATIFSCKLMKSFTTCIPNPLKNLPDP